MSGGGVFLAYYGKTAITDCGIFGNTGGGISNAGTLGLFHGSDLTVDRSTISGNGGGGLLMATKPLAPLKGAVAS